MRSRLRLVLRLIIGGALVWAAVGKLLQPAGFYSALTDYGVPLPEPIWQWVTISLPWLELLCGFALTCNAWPETVRPLVTILFGLFVVMTLQAAVRGLDLRCGCFGGAPDWFERPAVAMARAAILFGLSWALMNSSDQPGSVEA